MPWLLSDMNLDGNFFGAKRFGVETSHYRIIKGVI